LIALGPKLKLSMRYDQRPVKLLGENKIESMEVHQVLLRKVTDSDFLQGIMDLVLKGEDPAKLVMLTNALVDRQNYQFNTVTVKFLYSCHLDYLVPLMKASTIRLKYQKLDKYILGSHRFTRSQQNLAEDDYRFYLS